jgi:hypothetical protein
MRVHYRRLTNHFDQDAYEYTLAAEARDDRGFAGTQGRGRTHPLMALLEAPRAVEVDAEEAEMDDVRKLVLDGWLRETDLVDLGQGWQTVGECQELSEECEAAAAGARRTRRATTAALVLLVVLAALVAYLYLMPAP